MKLLIVDGIVFSVVLIQVRDLVFFQSQSGCMPICGSKQLFTTIEHHLCDEISQQKHKPIYHFCIGVVQCLTFRNVF